MRKHLDLILGILSLILALPGFFGLFFTPYTTSAILVVTLAAALAIAALTARWFLNLPPYTVTSVICGLTFQNQDHATFSKRFVIRPNFPHLQEITFGGISQDGTVQNLSWNSHPISSMEKPKGTIIATVHFNPPLPWWKEHTGTLSYDTLHSYPANNEYQGFRVEHPTRRMEINIEFPAGRPCKPQTVYATLEMGAQPIALDPPPTVSPDGRTAHILVEHPQLAGQYWVYWEW